MATTIQMPPLKGDIAVNGNYFMIRFFICCGLYILSHSPVIVDWYRKAPRFDGQQVQHKQWRRVSAHCKGLRKASVSSRPTPPTWAQPCRP
ncbi:hypothetical protein IFM51744_01418 [Aspergillus udagawae]|nr:hypothetical protein IFM51744_01418 [Aspergillus udagawae]